MIDEGNIVLPGQVISAEAGFLRGLGTYISKDGDGVEPQLIASAAGHVERINKLITVNPVNSKYTGEVGDLVIGRITAVENKRWKADVLAHRDAVLQLSSVHLPGGEQRMRNAEDQLQMRTLFEEGDCVSGEIQNISNSNTGDSGGVISLHTRSLKYGKLENGLLVQVPAHCMKRLPQHYISLPVTSLTEENATITNYMDVVLGKNGFIWITRSIPEEWKTQLAINNNGETVDNEVTSSADLAESLEQLRARHRETPLTRSQRLDAARIRNIIVLLSQNGYVITPELISKLLPFTNNCANSSVSGLTGRKCFVAKDLIQQENIDQILQNI